MSYRRQVARDSTSGVLDGCGLAHDDVSAGDPGARSDEPVVIDLVIRTPLHASRGFERRLFEHLTKAECVDAETPGCSSQQ